MNYTIQKNQLRLFILAIAVPLLLFPTSCAQWSNTAKGGTAGAGAGAAIGGAIGSQSDDTAKGAVLGAALGGVTGAAIGRYMDKQKAEMEEKVADDAKIERVGNGIVVTFDSGILFPFDSDELERMAKMNLKEVVDVLEEYPDTKVLIQGHTDNTGSDDYNLALSRERAESVYNYAIKKGVTANRLVTEGLGESEPIASNETVSGRQKNRRVEIIIYPSDELEEKAADGKI